MRICLTTGNAIGAATVFIVVMCRLWYPSLVVRRLLARIFSQRSGIVPHARCRRGKLRQRYVMAPFHSTQAHGRRRRGSWRKRRWNLSFSRAPDRVAYICKTGTHDVQAERRQIPLSSLRSRNLHMSRMPHRSSNPDPRACIANTRHALD